MVGAAGAGNMSLNVTSLPEDEQRSDRGRIWRQGLRTSAASSKKRRKRSKKGGRHDSKDGLDVEEERLCPSVSWGRKEGGCRGANPETLAERSAVSACMLVY